MPGDDPDPADDRHPPDAESGDHPGEDDLSETTYALIGALSLLALVGVGLVVVGTLLGSGGSSSTHQDDGGSATAPAAAGTTPAVRPGVEATATDTADASATPTGRDVPVVDNGGRRERTVRVRVRVLDAEGDPVAGEPVTLVDAGGQRRRGTTGPDGRIVFRESVGPAPCNSLSLSLPDRDRTVDLGCHNGPETIDETVRTDPPEGPVAAVDRP